MSSAIAPSPDNRPENSAYPRGDPADGLERSEFLSAGGNQRSIQKATTAALMEKRMEGIAILDQLFVRHEWNKALVIDGAFGVFALHYRGCVLNADVP